MGCGVGFAFKLPSTTITAVANADPADTKESVKPAPDNRTGFGGEYCGSTGSGCFRGLPRLGRSLRASSDRMCSGVCCLIRACSGAEQFYQHTG